MEALVGQFKVALYVAAALAIAGILFGAYHHGVTVTDAKWEAEWAARDEADTEATLKATEAARELEQTRQSQMEEVQTDATKRLDQARATAATASTAADGLRKQVEQLLAAGRARSNSSTGTGSAPRDTSADLLAGLLDKSVQRNRQLAAIADSSRIAGLACEKAYDSLTSAPSSGR
jgi:chromosome segregation ATPase